MSVAAETGRDDGDGSLLDDGRLPGSLDRPIDLDLEGRHRHPVVRRGILGLFAVIAVAALGGAFGQQANRSIADSDGGARLSLEAPERLRNGLIFSARFDIAAGSAGIERPALVLGNGWIDHITLNTLHPEPVLQTGRDGRLLLGYPPVTAGETLTVWTQWQVNPTTTGRFNGDVDLYDGDRLLTNLDRTITVFP